MQGLTGREGTFHAQAGRGLRHHRRRRRDARQGRDDPRGLADLRHGARRPWSKTGANASVIFVPPPFAADAVMEAADAGIALVVCITEGIPTLDMMRAMTFLKERPDTRLVGPNCPGVISPGKAKAGIIPAPHLQGRPHRHRLEERHADLRGDPPADAARAGPDDVHRHRRRSVHRHDPHRRAEAVRGRSGHRRRDHDRRDRRQRRGRGRGVDQGALQEAGRRRSSPVRRRRPDGGWATPARSSRAARARPPRRWRRSTAAGVTRREEPGRYGAGDQGIDSVHRCFRALRVHRCSARTARSAPSWSTPTRSVLYLLGSTPRRLTRRAFL